MIKRTTSEIMLLVLSIMSAILISPFVYLRYIDNDFIVATVDALIILMLLIFFTFVYKTRQVDKAKLLLAIFLAVSITLLVIIRGQPHLYWLYPAIIAFYYILSEKLAGIICLVAITIISIQIFPDIGIIDFFTIIMSLLLTSVFSYMIFSNYRKTNEQLTLLATIDPLTLSGNRRALDDKLSDILADQKRQASKISLLLFDLDLFKQVNDRYGHAVGDQVLIEVTDLIKDHTRALDTLFRYGGEEFIVVPLKVELADALIVAEKLRILVEQNNFVNDIPITISFGVAEYRIGETAETWIHRADSALYLAKDAGRNKVVSETEILSSDLIK
jgi:diguanylate cyclase (GGDEF)-like protein